MLLEAKSNSKITDSSKTAGHEMLLLPGTGSCRRTDSNNLKYLKTISSEKLAWLYSFLHAAKNATAYSCIPGSSARCTPPSHQFSPDLFSRKLPLSESKVSFFLYMLYLQSTHTQPYSVTSQYPGKRVRANLHQIFFV